MTNSPQGSLDSLDELSSIVARIGLGYIKQRQDVVDSAKAALTQLITRERLDELKRNITGADHAAEELELMIKVGLLRQHELDRLRELEALLDKDKPNAR